MLIEFRIVLIVATAVISIFGILFAWRTFPRKEKIFILISIAFVACTIQEIGIHIRGLYSNNSPIYYFNIVVSAISYFYLFFVVNQLYVLRLRSLGCTVKYEGMAKYVPYVILLVAICIQVEFLVFIFVPGLLSVPVYVGISISLFCMALLLEIYLCIILIQKVLMMLEYREQTQQKTILKTKLYLVLIVVLELSIFFIRVFYFNPDSPEGHIRILGFLVRIFIVVDFYGDIISSITNEDENNQLTMRNFYSDSVQSINILKPEV